MLPASSRSLQLTVATSSTHPVSPGTARSPTFGSERLELESEAEKCLDDFRIGVRADISNALSVFPSQWATIARETRRPSWLAPDVDEASLVLPPLRPLKDYFPTQRTDAPTATLPHSRAARARAPCASHLGEVPVDEPLQAPGLSLEEAATAVARRRIALARQRQAMLQEDEHAARQPLIERARTICMSERKSKVRGFDPMAGGLLSRHAKLDQDALKRGIYEAALCDRKKATTFRSAPGGPHSAR